MLASLVAQRPQPLSSSFALILSLAVLFALLATASGVAVRRRQALPEHAWWRVAGATFSSDEQERVTAYDHSDRERKALQDHAGVAREALAAFNGGSADRIAHRAVAGLEEFPRELASFLEARARGLERLTVVLFGRTKSGKSTLFAALTGQGFDGIGDGRQNVTRENRRARLGAVEVVDSPGISGVGSLPLEETTLAAVREADVVVVQITDDRLSREDLERIEQLAWPPRPVVIAVNIKAGDLERVVQRPDKVFREEDLDAHVGRLREGLPSFAGRHLPVVRYHALGAATARRSRWRRDRRALWEASGIEALLDQLRDVGVEATAAARRVPPALAERTAHRVDALLATCAEEARTQQEGEERGLAQVHGVMDEARGRRALARAAVDEHFSEAELTLIEAFAASDVDAYRDRVQQALDPAGLGRRIEEILNAIRTEMIEKFEELAEELEVLGVEVDDDFDEFEALWEEVQRDRRTLDDTARQRKRRRIVRAIIRGAVTGAAGVAGAAASGGPAAAAAGGAGDLAAKALLDRVLPDIEVPSQSRDAHLQRTRQFIEGRRRDALQTFQSTLESELLHPLEQRVVSPRLGSIGTLARFVATAEGQRQILSASPHSHEEKP